MVKQIKWSFLLLAIAAAVSMMATGLSIGFRSVPGIISSLVALVIVMGFGFKKKKSMRENGEL